MLGEHHKKITIRKQLIQAKRKFDEYIDALSDKDWKRRFGTTHFTVGEVMMQNTSSLEFIPQVIGDILKGKTFSGPPSFISPVFVKFIQFFFGGFLGRDLKQYELKKRYAQAHRKVMDLIESLENDAWDKKTHIFDKEVSIEDIFRSYFTTLYNDLQHVYDMLTESTK